MTSMDITLWRLSFSCVTAQGSQHWSVDEKADVSPRQAAYWVARSGLNPMEHGCGQAAVGLRPLCFETGLRHGDLQPDRAAGSGRDYQFGAMAESRPWATRRSSRGTAVGPGGELAIAARSRPSRNAHSGVHLVRRTSEAAIEAGAEKCSPTAHMRSAGYICDLLATRQRQHPLRAGYEAVAPGREPRAGRSHRVRRAVCGAAPRWRAQDGAGCAGAGGKPDPTSWLFTWVLLTH